MVPEKIGTRKIWYRKNLVPEKGQKKALSGLCSVPTGSENRRNRKSRQRIGQSAFRDLQNAQRRVTNASETIPSPILLLKIIKNITVFLVSIGASFFSDRPRHFWFRPKKLVLGPLDLFVPFLSFYEISLLFSRFVFGGSAPKS